MWRVLWRRIKDLQVGSVQRDLEAMKPSWSLAVQTWWTMNHSSISHPGNFPLLGHFTTVFDPCRWAAPLGEPDDIWKNLEYFRVLFRKSTCHFTVDVMDAASGDGTWLTIGRCCSSSSLCFNSSSHLNHSEQQNPSSGSDCLDSLSLVFILETHSKKLTRRSLLPKLVLPPSWSKKKRKEGNKSRK